MLAHALRRLALGIDAVAAVARHGIEGLGVGFAADMGMVPVGLDPAVEDDVAGLVDAAGEIGP